MVGSCAEGWTGMVVCGCGDVRESMRANAMVSA